ncbi:MAG: MBL fold metallo-hydrolase [Desulfobacteraceae bacterium]|nr:MBL fold metallo-hydrolase [Desulfobacteraceae bacterium]
MDIHDSGIRVTILGSGTCVPSLERGSCSVLVEHRESNFLLDVGPGTMGQLLKAGKTIFDIDALFLSHFHPDHASELSGFLFSTRYADDSRPGKPLHLAGGPGLKEFYDNLNYAFENKLVLDDLRLHELTGDSPLVLGGCSIRSAPMVHKPESRAYCFTSKEKKRVVYSGDTDYSEDLIRLAGDADLLICESAFPDELKREGHLTPSLAGAIAQEAGVRQLILTHIYPECDRVDIVAQCRQTYDGPLAVARDLMVVEL